MSAASQELKVTKASDPVPAASLQTQTASATASLSAPETKSETKEERLDLKLLPEELKLSPLPGVISKMDVAASGNYIVLRVERPAAIWVYLRDKSQKDLWQGHQLAVAESGKDHKSLDFILWQDQLIITGNGKETEIYRLPRVMAETILDSKYELLIGLAGTKGTESEIYQYNNYYPDNPSAASADVEASSDMKFQLPRIKTLSEKLSNLALVANRYLIGLAEAKGSKTKVCGFDSHNKWAALKHYECDFVVAMAHKSQQAAFAVYKNTDSRSSYNCALLEVKEQKIVEVSERKASASEAEILNRTSDPSKNLAPGFLCLEDGTLLLHANSLTQLTAFYIFNPWTQRCVTQEISGKVSCFSTRALDGNKVALASRCYSAQKLAGGFIKETSWQEITVWEIQNEQTPKLCSSTQRVESFEPVDAISFFPDGSLIAFYLHTAGEKSQTSSIKLQVGDRDWYQPDQADSFRPITTEMLDSLEVVDIDERYIQFF